MSYPKLDDSLIDDVLDAIGVTRCDDVETITTGFRGWFPGGSTAKWQAIDAGGVAPGADPDVGLEARLAGSLVSWSCWPMCTGLGAVLASTGHDVRVAVEHRRGGGAVPVVDHHSVLIVDGELLDPYLGPSAPVPPGEDVTRADAWSSWVPGVRPDHLGVWGGGSPFRYRLLADRLDRRDVAAFCAISETHSGVGRRRTAHWLRDGHLWFVRDGASAGDDAELRVCVGESPFASTRRVVARGRFDDLCHEIEAGSEVAR